MKKILRAAIAVVSLLLPASSGLQARNIHVTAGYAYTFEALDGLSIGTGDTHGMFVGAGCRIPIIAGLAVAPEIDYAFHFHRSKSGISTTVGHNAELSVDLLYQFNFTRNFGVFLLGGPRLAYGLAASYIPDEGARSDYYSGGYMNRANFLLGCGLGFEIYKHYRFQASYNFGMNDLYAPASGTHRDSRISGGISYVF